MNILGKSSGYFGYFSDICNQKGFMENNIVTELGSGRISDIINALEKRHKGQPISRIPTIEKIDALCRALDLSYDELDSLIADNSPVLRTVKGHCFEVAMESILYQNKIESKDIGGDSDVDLFVNGHTLQLKTPYLGGTTDTEYEYKTHKTHGAKSELESMDYYHKVSDFADFFVGLISYNPFKVLIIPREKLPRHPKDNRYIKSPFKISINKGISEESPYINAFHLLGISLSQIKISDIANGANELLPKSAMAIGVNSDIIVNTILREPNFRIWDMSIRGFAREVVVKRYLHNIGVCFSDKPSMYKKERGEKADLAIIRNSKTLFIQVKGISTNNCSFNKLNSIIATETQLTRGRVNDHPTQSRLYKVTDFDYLLLAIDPPISYMIYKETTWKIFLIPSNKLVKHARFPNRYNTIQKYKASNLLDYEIEKYKDLLV